MNWVSTYRSATVGVALSRWSKYWLPILEADIRQAAVLGIFAAQCTVFYHYALQVSVASDSCLPAPVAASHTHAVVQAELVSVLVALVGRGALLDGVGGVAECGYRRVLDWQTVLVARRAPGREVPGLAAHIAFLVDFTCRFFAASKRCMPAALAADQGFIRLHAALIFVLPAWTIRAAFDRRRSGLRAVAAHVEKSASAVSRDNGDQGEQCRKDEGYESDDLYGGWWIEFGLWRHLYLEQRVGLADGLRYQDGRR
ncbi:hypothetical protein EK21DRAFT_92813 [Setomelanomma holmii]|uniref:Uncharacterized protein n=1 Tax=Setomelanomma holmii TaxID=210430 RepID=A0A9P4H003_9PLEO|nr:hypothetical protein EK21DRAFT_92813 [Setomelanomma holmii]